MSPALQIRSSGDRTASPMAAGASNDGYSCHPSLARARALIGKLFSVERGNVSTDDEALKRVGTLSGVGFSTLHNIAKRSRAKDVRATVIERLEAAYLDLCERQLAHWKHELLIARKATPDVAFTDLEEALEHAAARLADAREASLAGRVRRGLAERGIRRSARSDDHLKTPDSSLVSNSPRVLTD